MNKGRVEAFSDAIVAIIMTIMILEFKTPEDFHWQAILENLTYLFAYAVSFFFIAVAWYNHHYMFSLTKRVTKKIYWINNIWLFTMALIPVATAWAGEFMSHRGPEYFIFLFLPFGVWLTCGLAKVSSNSIKKNTLPSAKKFVKWGLTSI